MELLITMLLATLLNLSFALAAPTIRPSTSPSGVAVRDDAAKSQIFIQRAQLTSNSVNEYFITTTPVAADGNGACPAVLGLLWSTPAPDKPGIHVPANVDYPYYLAFYADGVGYYSLNMDINEWVLAEVPTGTLLDQGSQEVGTCRAARGGAVTGSCQNGDEAWHAVTWFVCDLTA